MEIRKMVPVPLIRTPAARLHGAYWPWGLIFVGIMQATGSFARDTPAIRTASFIRALDNSCVCFRAEYGTYPPQATWMVELTGAEGASLNTRRARVAEESFFRDGWGRAFVYRCPGIHNPASYDLYSLGKDGLSQTGGNDPDDINSWNPAQPWVLYYEGRSWVKVVLQFIALVLGVVICAGALLRLFGVGASPPGRPRVAR